MAHQDRSGTSKSWPNRPARRPGWPRRCRLADERLRAPLSLRQPL